ncbi:uncharacterized protein LOC131932689 [Physella acuta]|uniref:uncharacterized protein LOC131932689 n=1 Tax=Physella acuta TaxID=109671 RepID=UPI0027DE31CF|nr:uncharacterized protein LOC131932689 [Physella acuta]
MLPVMFTPYFMFYLAWVYDPATNRTLLGSVPRVNLHDVSPLAFFVTDCYHLLTPCVTFTFIIACTAVTARQLKQIGVTRQSMTSGSPISTKEKKLVKMLVIVSLTFIACLLPTSVTLTAVGLVPDMAVTGSYFDVSLLIYELSYLTETISSSINVLVYYSMSSKYKSTVKSLFQGKEKLMKIEINSIF